MEKDSKYNKKKKSSSTLLAILISIVIIVSIMGTISSISAADSPYSGGDLNAVVTGASPNDAINVSSGTYTDPTDTITNIVVNKNLTIAGDGDPTTVILDANNNNYFFKVESGYTLTLQNLTLKNGKDTSGGAVTVETGATLNLINCIFETNYASNYGGAIYSEGIVNVTNSNFTANTATDGGAINIKDGFLTINGGTFDSNIAVNGGGLSLGFGFGGAIYCQGILNVINGNFTGNQAPNGGAIYCEGILTVTDGSFTANQATEHGGAIEVENGTLTVTGGEFTS
ncbi:MAG: hypothetical protein LBR24_02790, partial [Methanobrevibacter sp.]|nr:hypothetical protein [Methanobrevibacter sp.]